MKPTNHIVRWSPKTFFSSVLPGFDSPDILRLFRLKETVQRNESLLGSLGFCLEMSAELGVLMDSGVAEKLKLLAARGMASKMELQALKLLAARGMASKMELQAKEPLVRKAFRTSGKSERSLRDNDVATSLILTAGEKPNEIEWKGRDGKWRKRKLEEASDYERIQWLFQKARRKFKNSLLLDVLGLSLADVENKLSMTSLSEAERKKGAFADSKGKDALESIIAAERADQRIELPRSDHSILPLLLPLASSERRLVLEWYGLQTEQRSLDEIDLLTVAASNVGINPDNKRQILFRIRRKHANN